MVSVKWTFTISFLDEKIGMLALAKLPSITRLFLFSSSSLLFFFSFSFFFFFFFFFFFVPAVLGILFWKMQNHSFHLVLEMLLYLNYTIIFFSFRLWTDYKRPGKLVIAIFLCSRAHWCWLWRLVFFVLIMGAIKWFLYNYISLFPS